MFEVGSKFFAFARPECLRVLKKSIDCEAVEAEQVTNFSVGNPAPPIGLHDQRFERLSWELSRLGTECLHQGVRH